MAISVREVMTRNPAVLPQSATVMEAARTMRDSQIGDVIVGDANDGKIYGIVTDRDLIVRAVADGKDPRTTMLKEICSTDLVALTPTQTTDEAVALMRERAVRRLPVLDGKKVLGIVSLGDLAQRLDERSVLGRISAAEPNS